MPQGSNHSPGEQVLPAPLRGHAHATERECVGPCRARSESSRSSFACPPARGSTHFDGEWALVTNQMAVLGLGQVLLEHPEHRDRLLPAIRAATATMLEPEARAFGTESWGEDGLSEESLASDRGHVYLGYLNMALSMQRLVDAETSVEHRAINDTLTAAFARRLERAPYGLIETFPGVTFPVDVASAVASIALHARATGAPMPPVVTRWVAAVREQWIDPTSGFLRQTGAPETAARGRPRGSGTALAVYPAATGFGLAGARLF